MTDTTTPSGSDEIRALLQNELCDRTALLLKMTSSAGLLLQVPNSDIYILAGKADWIASQGADAVAFGSAQRENNNSSDIAQARSAAPAGQADEQMKVSRPFVAPAGLLNADELAALRRFDECAQDGEGYDVPKEMMHRLAEIGVVRRKSGAYYEATDFGQHVLGNTPIPSGPYFANDGREPDWSAYAAAEDEADLDEMVNRFLAWPLPAGLCPGIDRPIGTHLMNADQARAMLEYVLTSRRRAQGGQQALLGEILSLAEQGMCHGLLADDFCSQIVAKIKGESAAPVAGQQAAPAQQAGDTTASASIDEQINAVMSVPDDKLDDHLRDMGLDPVECEAAGRRALDAAMNTIATQPVQTGAAVDGKLHGFDRDDLLAIADGLEAGYEKTIDVGGSPLDGIDKNLIESTTAAAARFIRATLAPVAAQQAAACSHVWPEKDGQTDIFGACEKCGMSFQRYIHTECP